MGGCRTPAAAARPRPPHMDPASGPRRKQKSKSGCRDPRRIHPATSNTDPQRYSACAAESPMNGTAAVQGEKRLRDRVVPEEFRMGCEATALTQPAETAK